MKSVVINGATGWLGAATLRAISRLENFNNVHQTVFYGSSSRTQNIGEFGSFHIERLGDRNDKIKNADILVNLAFKTKDFILKLGEREYERENNLIISQSASLAKRLDVRSVILVSSGVVTRFLESNQTEYDDAYTRLKIHEEEEFTKVCESLGATLIVLRMWAATGEDMTEPNKYAIGNLLIQAHTSSRIQIESSRKVFRRYADASQQMELCLLESQDGSSKILNSGGERVEISELAEQIAKIYAPKLKVERKLVRGVRADKYYWSGNELEDSAGKYGINLINLENQIRLTNVSVQRYLKSLTTIS